jgi:phage terminase small subunit
MTETGKKAPPPAGLSDRAKKLWRAALADFELSPAELEVLRSACETLDRADAAAKIVKREGVTVKDRYGSPKAHPAVDAELRARGLFARLVRQLGIEFEEAEADESPGTRQARGAAAARWGRVTRLDEARRARSAS